MISPDQIPDHPGPQGYANTSAPVSKGGIPWFKIVLVLLVLAVLLGVLNSCRGKKDRSNNASQTNESNSGGKPFYTRMLGSDRGDDIDVYPRLVYVLGAEAVFVYRGAHYRLPDGFGPIGGDWFCSVLDGSIATINSADGTAYRVGVDRSNSPDLRRGSGNSSGSISGGVRAPN